MPCRKEDAMTQGKRIRAIRKIRGFTRKGLGMKAGMNPKSAASRISRYEEDKCSPRKDTLMKIAEALNVSPMAIAPYTGRDFREILEILFWLEEAQNADGIGELSEIVTMMNVWETVKDKRNKGIISDKEYREWKLQCFCIGTESLVRRE